MNKYLFKFLSMMIVCNWSYVAVAGATPSGEDTIYVLDLEEGEDELPDQGEIEYDVNGYVRYRERIENEAQKEREMALEKEREPEPELERQKEEERAKKHAGLQELLAKGRRDLENLRLRLIANKVMPHSQKPDLGAFDPETQKRVDETKERLRKELRQAKEAKKPLEAPAVDNTGVDDEDARIAAMIVRIAQKLNEPPRPEKQKEHQECLEIFGHLQERYHRLNSKPKRAAQSS